MQRHPDNVEAWRLLGTVHAENDDDQQACTLHCSWGHAKCRLLVVSKGQPQQKVSIETIVRWLQAIAALNKALAADPRNAEVLLSLGVSYTNELDQGRALGYLLAWLSQQRSFAEVRIKNTLLHGDMCSKGHYQTLTLVELLQKML